MLLVYGNESVVRGGSNMDSPTDQPTNHSSEKKLSVTTTKHAIFICGTPSISVTYQIMFAAAAVFYAMLGCRRGRLLMVLSTLGLSRSYVMPRLGGRLAHCIRPARPSNTRLYRRSRGTSSRTDGSFEDGDSSSDEWNTWEFGTWKVRVISHAGKKFRLRV